MCRRHGGVYHPPMRPAVLACLSVLLAACAAKPPFPGVTGSPAPQPYRVVAGTDGQWQDREVLWGGMILEVRNFERHSEVELLAFPLDPSQRPVPHAADQGRFIALLSGFADPASLPEGRFVTLTGRITGERRGLLHTREYTWPEVDVGQLHLWEPGFAEPRTRFSVGIGVGVGIR